MCVSSNKILSFFRVAIVCFHLMTLSSLIWHNDDASLQDLIIYYKNFTESKNDGVFFTSLHSKKRLKTKQYSSH